MPSNPANSQIVPSRFTGAGVAVRGAWRPPSAAALCPGMPAASSTASRHSRVIGRIGGIGAVSGSGVGGGTDGVLHGAAPPTNRL